MATKYLSMFDRLFHNENRMSSTYKPVFLRAILDVGDLADPARKSKLIGSDWLDIKDGKLLVNLNFVAARFAKYYWDMEYGFKLRQSQDKQDANILRLIRSQHDGVKKPPTLKELSGRRMSEFRRHVIARSIRREVLVHLLTDMDGLYEKIDANTLAFDSDVIAFLHDHKTILRKGLNNMISKYLEKLNGSTPKIANKVDSEPGRRIVLKSEVRLRLTREQDDKCFYCCRRQDAWAADHVIPHNYVFSTDPYNCVMSCSQCNGTKHDRLPNREVFGRVLERNEGILDYLKNLEVPYDREMYVRMFDNCIRDYNGDDFFCPKCVDA